MGPRRRRLQQVRDRDGRSALVRSIRPGGLRRSARDARHRARRRSCVRRVRIRHDAIPVAHRLVHGRGHEPRHTDVGRARCRRRCALDASTIYGSVLPLRDITAGNNGAPCLVGFDLCSGRGSWTGTGYATDWAASDVPRLLQSATYLATTPDQVQKLGVQLIAYLLALKPPADATPLVPPPDNTGTVSFTTADRKSTRLNSSHMSISYAV